MAMPVSTRKDTSAGGNAFVPTRAVVPVGDDPAARFEAIHAQLDQTKHERVLGLVDQLAGLLNLLPTSVLARFTLEQARTVDFTTSNVRAAPFDLFIAGARIEATYPLGPLGSTAFNLTMMSYRGELNMGLHMDTVAIEQPDLLHECLETSFAALIAAKHADQVRSVRRELLDLQAGEQESDVEQQIGNLVGRHELAMLHLVQPAIDDGQDLDQEILSLLRVGHHAAPGVRGLSWDPPYRPSPVERAHNRPSRPEVTRPTHCGHARGPGGAAPP